MRAKCNCTTHFSIYHYHLHRSQKKDESNKKNIKEGNFRIILEHDDEKHVGDCICVCVCIISVDLIK